MTTHDQAPTEMFAYRVRFHTSNALGDAVETPSGYAALSDRACVVVTSDPRTIYDFFGDTNIESVQNIGPGYTT